MMSDYKKKGILDIGIIIISCICVAVMYRYQTPERIFYLIAAIALLVCLVCVADLYRIFSQAQAQKSSVNTEKRQWIARTLCLLDEQNHTIKSWDLSGKVSMIIGRKSKDEDVDVDLADCEYSAMIDVQHAVLNFTLDSWYLEDLDSHNGVKVKKVEDGVCYQLTQSRPCRIMPGDVIYIANTKLLFT